MLFNALKNEKNLKYYNPIAFINNYDNENIDVSIQKDIHEFFLDLLDKLKIDKLIYIIIFD